MNVSSQEKMWTGGRHGRFLIGKWSIFGSHSFEIYVEIKHRFWNTPTKSNQYDIKNLSYIAIPDVFGKSITAEYCQHAIRAVIPEHCLQIMRFKGCLLKNIWISTMSFILMYNGAWWTPGMRIRLWNISIMEYYRELKEKYGELIPDTVKLLMVRCLIKAASGETNLLSSSMNGMYWSVMRHRIIKYRKSILIFCVACLKGQNCQKYIALAYLTGILPIKKLKTQSALNNLKNLPCWMQEEWHRMLALQKRKCMIYVTGTDRSMSRWNYGMMDILWKGIRYIIQKPLSTWCWMENIKATGPIPAARSNRATD